MPTYTYSQADDFGGVQPDLFKLHHEIINHNDIDPYCLFVRQTTGSDTISISFLCSLDTTEQSHLNNIVANHTPNSELATITLTTNGNGNTSYSIVASQTDNRTITLPDATTNIIGHDTNDILTNKTLTSTTNNITAKSLHSNTTIIDISSATAPTSGQVLTATSSTTAIWQNSSANVTGTSSSLDKELITFDGTTGKAIIGCGIRHYGASNTDPTSPTPQAGDKYYNTSINHEMCYDASRSKWLSITTLIDGCGRNGTTTGNTFYKRFNGMGLSTTLGSIVPKGTIIMIGFSSGTAGTHTFEVLVGGVVVATLDSGGSASAFSDTFNADFDTGIMSMRNQTGSDTTSNFQATVYYKLRA
jgi:hypothetical protein